MSGPIDENIHINFRAVNEYELYVEAVMGKWIEVLKAGTFKAKNGQDVTITDSDLDAIAAANPSKDRKAPLVFGHPTDDQPAFGWLDGVKRAGGVLLASFSEVPDVVKNLVKDGYYRKVSLSLMPDKKTIRHVGLLGAVQPAVPGLKDVSFGNGADAIDLEHEGGDPSGDPEHDNTGGKPDTEDAMSEELKRQLEEAKVKAAELQAQVDKNAAEAEAAKKELSDNKAAAERNAIETKVNDLVGKKILAKDKPLVERIALALGAGEEIELSSGAGKKPLRDHLFDFLSGLPDLDLMTEFSSPSGDEKGVKVDMGSLTKFV